MALMGCIVAGLAEGGVIMYLLSLFEQGHISPSDLVALAGIAVTHDDRWFHVADRVLKMVYGQVVEG